MRRESGRARHRRILWPLLLLAAVALDGRAERLPVHLYTSSDGLPRDSVFNVRQDSRGFIWVLTGDGISRFDGYGFTNYTTDDGLPDRRVNDLLETRGGVYWLATSGGLCRFNPRGVTPRGAARGAPTSPRPSGQRRPDAHTSTVAETTEPMFAVFNPGDSAKPVAFNVLWEDGAGVVWCGTARGLYRLEESGGGARFEFVDLGARTASRFEGGVTAIIGDRRGDLWVATDASGLYRLAPDGGAERYTTEQGLPSNQIASLLEDRDGRVWVGMHNLTGGLCLLVTEPDPRRRVVERLYTKEDGLPSGWVPALSQTRDGRLWVGTVAGLALFEPPAGEGGASFRAYSAGNGLCDSDIWGLLEDRANNLWVASRCGLIKAARNGFTAYGTEDGLGTSQINSIFEGDDGALTVVNLGPAPHGRIVNRFDGRRFTATTPPIPPRIKYHGWGWGQTIIEDHTGEWWVPTGDNALLRFPRVGRIEQLASSSPKAVYSTRDGLTGTEVFRLYEDAAGDIWVATTGTDIGLARWERSSDRFHDLTGATGVLPKTDFTAFREDGRGNLWIGTAEGGLLRYREGRFRRFTEEDGAPPGWVIALYLDHAGRLWIASSLGGLCRLDDTSSESPRFVRYTTADGLSSNNVRSIAEDAWGRIYAGTGHGVDRLDPANGRVKHFTAADGLPRNVVEHAYRDRDGALWFGSPFGVARLVPEPDVAAQPPSVYVTGLSLGGLPQRVSELGETELPRRELQPAENQVGVDFVGVGFDLGEELLYQYRLEGAGDDWSPPSPERKVNYASLSPGEYRFVVRVVSAEGQVSPRPAAFAFTVLAPVWRRPWFLALSVLAAGLSAFALYRYRVARLLEVANVRARIATDLHDDIGANLTKIAILSEVARRQSSGGKGEGAEGDDGPVSAIARISRESVASMRDIVWAIDPQRDTLLDLVRRMRRHAEELFTAHDVTLVFNAPAADGQRKLDLEVRGDVFLVFKEATGNVARHARCSRVEVELSADDHELVLRVKDDGVGFDPAAERDGHGLSSMRRRAAELGGTLRVESSKGVGTTVTLRVRRTRTRRRR